MNTGHITQSAWHSPPRNAMVSATTTHTTVVHNHLTAGCSHHPTAQGRMNKCHGNLKKLLNNPDCQEGGNIGFSKTMVKNLSP